MEYRNPVITGFYPDPSVCRANGKFYLVASSFQYFPGVPLFESNDLLNWEQIGNVLTRESQLPLKDAKASGGIYAPTIRENAGRFYMVVTNVSGMGNFYVYTDDIYGEWSDPIKVDQGGIDPSLYFEDGRAYFCSNGNDPACDNRPGIQMCEIDIETGAKLSESRYIWYGSGGRFVEAPHIHKINGKYILLTAEGGTEYGHMVTYAVSDSLFGEYKGYEKNPVLTNRNLGGYPVQGIGHADLVEDYNGNWWLLHLGFRQQSMYETYHHLGRETFLTPVTFGEDGFFTAGATSDLTGAGTVQLLTETDRFPEDKEQQVWVGITQSDDDFNIHRLFLRNPDMNNYTFTPKKITLRGTDHELSSKNPTFVGLRQKEFEADISVKLTLTPETKAGGAAGITLYMDEDHHYDLHAQRTTHGTIRVIAMQNIGSVKYSFLDYIDLPYESIKLSIIADRFNYYFYANYAPLGSAPTKYLSTEVAGGFTGVIVGLYAQYGDAEFEDFEVKYHFY